MEIVEVIKPKENVKEFIEEKLKKAIKEVTPYKKPLVQSVTPRNLYRYKLGKIVMTGICIGISYGK